MEKAVPEGEQSVSKGLEAWHHSGEGGAPATMGQVWKTGLARPLSERVRWGHPSWLGSSGGLETSAPLDLIIALTNTRHCQENITSSYLN